MISTGSRRNGWPLLLKIEAAWESCWTGKKIEGRGQKGAQVYERQRLHFPLR
jgi:hypothetical protein